MKEVPLPEITKEDINAPNPDPNEYDSSFTALEFFSGFSIDNKPLDNWNLLRRIDPQRIPSMMSANLDGDVILAIVQCVKNYNTLLKWELK